jgi:tetratricopeptide (TPR) repeat protein
LEAYVAVAEKRPDADEALDRFEELMLIGPESWRDISILGNLILAQLLTAQGRNERALEAIRRRSYVWMWSTPYLSSYLREEARLAAQTGDHEGAIRAYRHYLALRSDPEPGLTREVARVWAELEELLKWSMQSGQRNRLEVPDCFALQR